MSIVSELPHTPAPADTHHDYQSIRHLTTRHQTKCDDATSCAAGSRQLFPCQQGSKVVFWRRRWRARSVSDEHDERHYNQRRHGWYLVVSPLICVR